MPWNSNWFGENRRIKSSSYEALNVIKYGGRRFFLPYSNSRSFSTQSHIRLFLKWDVYVLWRATQWETQRGRSGEREINRWFDDNINIACPVHPCFMSHWIKIIYNLYSGENFLQTRIIQRMHDKDYGKRCIRCFSKCRSTVPFPFRYSIDCWISKLSFARASSCCFQPHFLFAYVSPLFYPLLTSRKDQSWSLLVNTSFSLSGRNLRVIESSRCWISC